jgi:hypothetical protein
MTNPAHYTDPKWAAREARRQALEEAAALCENYARGGLSESWATPLLNVARTLRFRAKAPA